MKKYSMFFLAVYSFEWKNIANSLAEFYKLDTFFAKRAIASGDIASNWINLYSNTTFYKKFNFFSLNKIIPVVYYVKKVIK